MGNKHHRHHHHNDHDVAPDDAQIKQREKRVEGKIHFKVNDPQFIEMPKWPIILLDTTGSMNETCTAGSTLSRKDLVAQCLSVIVKMLAAADDADNQPEGWQRGCPLITFNAIDGGRYRGFVHPDNLTNELGDVPFRGGTHIMDGWRIMLQTYENFFYRETNSRLADIVVFDNY